MDKGLQISTRSNIAKTAHKYRTIIFFNRFKKKKIKTLKNLKILLVQTPLEKDGNFNLKKILIKIKQFGLSRILLESGLSNTTVISSNCKNGPQEILDNENNGYLFKNNNLNDLLKKFDEFKKEKVSELNKKKLKLKKEIKKFTLYSHFKSLNNIINLNN